mgnify:CR=1 FL=1
MEVIEVDVNWGEGLPLEKYREVLSEDQAHEIKAVIVTHNETATGVTSDLAGVRALLDKLKHPALLFVGCEASIGKGMGKQYRCASMALIHITCIGALSISLSKQAST